MGASYAVGRQVARPLRSLFLERLTDSGTWMTRQALAEGASSSPPAIEDALADLVMEGKAEYRQGGGYRLAGTDLQRRAAQALRANPKHKRAVVGLARRDRPVLVLGVAEIREGLGMLLYELEVGLPPGSDPNGQLARVCEVLDAAVAQQGGL